MRRAEVLARFMKNGEKQKAENLLDEISKENECRAYCVALEKILLTEAVQMLNDSVRGFYMDTDKLKEAFFSENPPTRKTVFDSVRDILHDAVQEDRERTFNKAVAYIKGHIADNQLSVFAVSEYCGVSENALLKIFKDYDGKTTAEYINKLRVDISLAYLNNDESVTAAAEKSGFSSVETYIRTFKKYMETTPGLWKRNKLFL